MYTSEMPFLRKVSHVKKKDDGPCPICMSELSEGSGYTEDSVDDGGVYKLTKCGHMLHAPCVKAYIENSSFTKVSACALIRNFCYTKYARYMHELSCKKFV